MKKSLLALAVLGAFTGAAVAQSSVTLFGIVDLSGRYVKNDGQRKRLSLAEGALNSNRLGFRGIEDLGGGLRAGFWLEAGMAPDIGTAGTLNAASGSTTINQSKFFNRRSTVSLISNAGELRLGRDYVPQFWNTAVFDAFGFVGLGSSGNVHRYIHVRQDNSIGYFLPANIGGFYGQAMVAAGEGASTGVASTLDRPGRHLSARLGFAAGPVDISVSGGTQRFTASSTPTGFVLAGDNVKLYNVGASWDFGFVKVFGYAQRTKFDAGKEQIYSLSAQTTFGQNVIRVGYNRSKLDADSSSDSTVQQIAATYQYNLSKRTAMYGTVSVLDNKDASSVALPGGFLGTGTGAFGAGDRSKGFELGVRHIF